MATPAPTLFLDRTRRCLHERAGLAFDAASRAWRDAAHDALCLVAVGGGYGTLSEIAFGMPFGKRVFGLEGAPHVDGVVPLSSDEAAMSAVARVALAHDGETTFPHADAPA